MKDTEVTFVIPTHRLRDAAETVDAYDEHFWRGGHDVRIVVFDDGTIASRDKYRSAGTGPPDSVASSTDVLVSDVLRTNERGVWLVAEHFVDRPTVIPRV
jgi:hypothetical protein